MTPKKTARKTPAKNAAFVCPECARTDFKDARHLGVHRKVVHKVAGSSSGAVEYQRRRLKELTQATEAAKPAPAVEAPQSAPAPRAAAAISPILVGYAVANLENLVVTIARAHRVPEEEFLKLVASQLLALNDR